MILNTDLTKAIEYLDKGIQDRLKVEIKKSLMEHAEKIVEDVSTELARNIRANIIHYDSYLDSEVKMVLQIDGVKQEVK